LEESVTHPSAGIQFAETLFPAFLINAHPSASDCNIAPTTIDVQKLKVAEAIRRTEKAVRDMLLQGGTVLRVITDGSVLNSTHLAIIGEMQKHRIYAEQDNNTSNMVIITLPQK